MDQEVPLQLVLPIPKRPQKEKLFILSHLKFKGEHDFPVRKLDVFAISYLSFWKGNPPQL